MKALSAIRFHPVGPYAAPFHKIGNKRRKGERERERERELPHNDKLYHFESKLNDMHMHNNIIDTGISSIVTHGSNTMMVVLSPT